MSYSICKNSYSIHYFVKIPTVFSKNSLRFKIRFLQYTVKIPTIFNKNFYNICKTDNYIH